MAKGKRGFGSIYRRKKKLPDGSEIDLPIWWIKYSKNGKPFQESSRSRIKSDAERLLKKRLGDIVTGRFGGLAAERVRLAELFEEVTRDYKDNAKSSIKHVERRLRLHLIPAFGHVRVAEFGTSHVRLYTSKRRHAGATNATMNRELAIVKRAFRLGAQADPPIVNRIPHIPMLAENNVRKGFLEADVYSELLTELPPDLRPVFVVGYHTGARVGELLKLRWSQVDLSARRITLNPGTTKNKEGRTLPIYGQMLAVLEEQHAEKERTFPDCPFVFHRHGKAIRSLRKAWNAACERAGIGGLFFHDLRRTAVRNMVRAGIPEKVAMQISGHKTRSVFDRYNIVSDRDLEEAAKKLERHLASLATPSATPKKKKGRGEQ